jgi:cysteine-rich repeat protein
MKIVLCLLVTAVLLSMSAGCSGSSSGHGVTPCRADSDDPCDVHAPSDVAGDCGPQPCQDMSEDGQGPDDSSGDGPQDAMDGAQGPGCAPETYLTDCPSRPCEVATCEGGRCTYAPVACDGAPCACRTDACGDQDLRSCGDAVCAGSYCEPAPSLLDGALRYENRCVTDTTSARCGVCGLGQLSCDEATQAFSCDDMSDSLEAAGLDLAWVECDSTLLSSTFVFVDTAYSGADADGSRDRPFATVDEGVQAAASRMAHGVVVAGAPTFEEHPPVAEGVSLYGGYQGQPDWRADRSLRPGWRVPYSGPTAGAEGAEASPRFIGLRVEGFERSTTLSDVHVETADVIADPQWTGVSNYAFVVTSSPGLRLIRVSARAGAAGDGGPGERGWTPNPGADGQPGAENCLFVPADDLPVPHCVASGGVGGDELGCPGQQSRGGDGGDAIYSGDIEEFALGLDGEPAPADGGGTGGLAAQYIPGSGNAPPTPGGPGSDAPQAYPPQAGPGVVVKLPQADGSGSIHFALAVEAQGKTGAIGSAGAGGGGGAGGEFVNSPSPYYSPLYTYPAVTYLLSGTSGGGGGAGGCGGLGGDGGGPGGYSVALLVDDSTDMHIRACSFIAGDGGRGGEGGLGGAGAPGGAGGPGGTTLDALLVLHQTDPTYEQLFGTVGGHGGRGQPGGAGGNGAGGSSIGAHCRMTTPTLIGESTFEAAAPGLGGDNPLAPEPTPGPTGDAVRQRGCFPECGNGFIEGDEQCDDGNTEGDDGCEADCALP